MNFNELYYLDAYRKSFVAKVVQTNEAQERMVGKQKQLLFPIVLDQTCFYPEGGGQPGDRGVLLTATTEIAVLDTTYRGEQIIHWCDQPLAVATEIRGEIDFVRRFDLMQQHSGEHIVSGLINKRFGYNNVGFHIAETYTTFDFDGPISPTVLAEIELEANAVVQQNLPLQISYPTESELVQIAYRSKKELSGQVRLVSVPEVDCCACCGTHVHTTGEIGLIVFTKHEPYKGGVRITVLCGQRAVKYQLAQRQVLEKIARSSSVKIDDVPELFLRLQEERNFLQAERKKQNEEIVACYADMLQLDGATDYFVWITDLFHKHELPKIATNLMEQTTLQWVAVIRENEIETEKEVLTHCQLAVASKCWDLRTLAEVLRKEQPFKGGGKTEIMQGSAELEAEEIASVLENYWQSQSFAEL